MQENDISCLRYNCLVLAEAEQIHRFILDCLCSFNVERLAEHSSQLTQAASIKMCQCSF